MAKVVRKEELSDRSGLVAIRNFPFTSDEIAKLTSDLTVYTLVSDGQLFFMYGEKDLTEGGDVG